MLPFSLLAAVSGALLSGCGQARQDAQEQKANYTLDVVSASFPSTQRIAANGRLVLVLRNAGNHTVPDLAVTINSFTEHNAQQGLANSQRPVWIVNDGPGPAPKRTVENTGPDTQGGYVTAYTNTWAAGPLAAGKTATLVWKVTPVRSGTHTVSYRVAAGLNGNAHALTSNGQPAEGSFTVNISHVAAQAHVDPNTGRVLAGPAQAGG